MDYLVDFAPIAALHPAFEMKTPAILARALLRYSLLGIGMIGLSGCGYLALRHSLNDYNGSYAETQNHQMLLNLARLHNREPVYFFQIAQISDSYTFTNNFSLGYNKASGLPNSTTVNARTGLSSIGGTATNQPIFTLIPLAGDKFAQQLLAPIKPDIFYELYQEGWPIDLLMRVLIARIEIRIKPDAAKEAAAQEAKTAEIRKEDAGANPGKAVAEADHKIREAAKNVLILENDPWACVDDVRAANPDQPGPTGHYDRFLRACALAREFQRHGLLHLATEKQFRAAAPMRLDAPNARAIEKAAKDGLTWQPIVWDDSEDSPEEGTNNGEKSPGVRIYKGDNKGTWVLGKSSSGTSFRLVENPGEDALVAALQNLPAYKGSDHPIQAFQKAVQIDVTGSTQVAGEASVNLVMRSLLGAMYALANEQAGFENFQKKMAEYNSLPTDSPYYSAPIPEEEDHPALTLFPKDDANFGTPVVTLGYNGEHYVIADPVVDSPVDRPISWNRDAFRLLVELSFLATSDPTSFSSPSLIQLH